MRLVSCSVCNKLVETKKTAVIEHKRVCHECGHKKRALRVSINPGVSGTGLVK